MFFLGAGYPFDSVEMLQEGGWKKPQSVEPAPQAGLKTTVIPPEATKKAFSVGLPVETAFKLSRRVKEEFFRTEVPFGTLIYQEALRHNLQPELVAAIVETESDFRPRLRSHKDARGLMQIIPSTGRLMGTENLEDPAENVRAGSKYLKYLTRRFKGNERMILAAYNAGEGNVERFGGIPPFEETREYLNRVERSRRRYEKMIATRLASGERKTAAAEVLRSGLSTPY